MKTKHEHRSIQYVSVKRLELVAGNEFWNGGAVFVRKFGVWGMIKCSKSLVWIKGKPLGWIKNELLRRGCKWEWKSIGNGIMDE